MFKRFKFSYKNNFYKIYRSTGAIGYINLNTIKTAIVETSRFPEAHIVFTSHDDKLLYSESFDSFIEARKELDRIFNNR